MNRKIVNEKVQQAAELYSSTIVDGIIKRLPDIDPVIVEIINELSTSGYIDGANMILDALEMGNPEGEKE